MEWKRTKNIRPWIHFPHLLLLLLYVQCNLSIVIARVSTALVQFVAVESNALAMCAVIIRLFINVQLLIFQLKWIAHTAHTHTYEHTISSQHIYRGIIQSDWCIQEKSTWQCSSFCFTSFCCTFFVVLFSFSFSSSELRTPIAISLEQGK